MITDTILEQLGQVREDGRTNMLDRKGVQVIADDIECHELVVWLEDVTPFDYMEALNKM